MSEALPTEVVPPEMVLDAALTSKSTEHEVVTALLGGLPKIKCTGDQWFQYEKGVWKEVARERFLPCALAILPPDIRTANRADALIRHIQGLCQVSPDYFTGATRFDVDGSVLVNCRNCVLRCRPGRLPEMLPHQPEYAFQQQVDAEWDMNADAPEYRRTLECALPDEADRDLFKICAGNMLYPDARFEVCTVCYGESGTSKSTVCEPLTAVLGDGLATSLSMTHLCDSRGYSLPKLKFAAANMSTELDAIEHEDSSIFKRIVSGETIEVRPIYGKPFTMRTACKLWFLANNLPRFKHGTEAEIRRMRLIRFRVLVGDLAKDVTLKPRIAGERNGVFLFMLEGLVALLGLREIPQGGDQSRALLDRFRTSNDPIGTFIRQRCELGSAFEVTKEELDQEFQSFCLANGFSDMLSNIFIRKLLERCPEVGVARPRRGSDRVHVVKGLRLLA